MRRTAARRRARHPFLHTQQSPLHHPSLEKPESAAGLISAGRVRTSMAAPNFHNVDLDIESKFDLGVLKTELGRKVYVLPGGPVSPGCFLLRLETRRQHNNPDDT